MEYVVVSGAAQSICLRMFKTRCPKFEYTIYYLLRLSAPFPPQNIQTQFIRCHPIAALLVRPVVVLLNTFLLRGTSHHDPVVSRPLSLPIGTFSGNSNPAKPL